MASGATKEREKTGKEIIEQGDWADCWICDEAFRRRRQTARYCKTCKRSFCEGEHGNFAHGFGQCIICAAKKSGQGVEVRDRCIPESPTSNRS